MIKIITYYYNNFNYGGMLQAFALAQFLRLSGLDTTQVAFNKKKPSASPPKPTRRPAPNWKRLFRRALTPQLPKKVAVRLYKMIVKILHARPAKPKSQDGVGIRLLKTIVKKRSAARRQAFERFQDFIPHSDEVFTMASIGRSVGQDDVFIAGSDQVWNPAWTRRAYFLDFVPDACGKIAYAASIGRNAVSQDFLDWTAPLLRRFDFISVREKSAKEILQPHLQQDIKVTLDPTMLLPRGEWDKVAVAPPIKKPYIFVYLLGKKLEHRVLVKRLARKLGLKIAFTPHLLGFNHADCHFADYNLYKVGPAEFLGLVKNAEMVIADSFHGCVFSIIYGKRFWALKRHKDSDEANMNSRLYTLFGSLGLEDRLLEDESREYDAAFLNAPIDYPAVEARLDRLRKESGGWLLGAIAAAQERMRPEMPGAGEGE